MNTAPLMQRIVLLHFINEIPQQLHVGKLQSFSAFGNGTSERLLDIGQEKELVEAFAFLASTTNDPRKIVAVSVEESRHDMRLVVRIAANHGGLEIVQRGLQGLANVLERVARGG
jgi:ribosomal protein S2